jgi:hypothetical protein
MSAQICKVSITSLQPSQMTWSMNCKKKKGPKYGKANSHIFANYYCKYTENKIKY